MTSALLATETLTFLFSDFESSTELLRRLGPDAYATLLADHHSLIRAALDAYGGTEVATQGDGFFAVSSPPSACVSAAIEMQRTLSSHRWTSDDTYRRQSLDKASTQLGEVEFEAAYGKGTRLDLRSAIHLALNRE